MPASIVGVPDVPTLARMSNHAVAAEDVTDGGAAWKYPAPMVLMHNREQHFRAPGVRQNRR